jgi:hypothetical protein
VRRKEMDLVKEKIHEIGRLIAEINEELAMANLTFRPEIKIIVKDLSWDKMLTNMAIRAALLEFREELEKKGVL